MPTIAPGSKVLVTGNTGFIAIWVARSLLEKGYSVRGTSRSESKAQYLREFFKLYGDKFETAIVEDISKAGAFDEVVKDVDGIEHIASPCHTKAEDPQEIIVPAVNGTVGILESTFKYNPNVKRIVITSSCASVFEYPLPTPEVFCEKDWNRKAIKEVEEQGRAADGLTKYCAPKTLAEKATWDFVERHKGKINWDISVINPPFVYGPIIHEVPYRSVLNVTSSDILNVLLTSSNSPDVMPYNTLSSIELCWIDVRDLAEVLVLALEKEEAGGERIIVSAGPYVWQDWIDEAHALTPPVSLPPHYKLTVGVPGSSEGAVHMIDFDTSKAARIFGLKYRSKADTVRAVLEDVTKKGW